MNKHRRIEVVIEAPVNIALIKYWGKRNEELVLPLNDSISLTVNQLIATTKISIGPHVKVDRICVNGRVVDPEHMARFRRVFDELRQTISRKRNASGELLCKVWHIDVQSQTNFPVAAGLASSAAGFAAIAYGLGKIFCLEEKEMIRLARIGSGSACRSIQSGFVHWKAGVNEKDDSDCTCESIAPDSHWPDLRAVILVVNQCEKKVGSSDGMRNTVRTSTLFKTRVKDLVPERVLNLKEAIRLKNFKQLAEITMAESNQLHALCLDTNPPLNYLNSNSHDLMEFVYDFNVHFGVNLAYTFDAGPNCCLLLEEKTLPLLELTFRKCFSFECKFPTLQNDKSDEETNGRNISTSSTFPWPIQRKIQLEQVVLSQVGIGPRLVSLTPGTEGDDLRNTFGHGSATVDCKML